MGQIHSILDQRLKKSSNTNKMSLMAQKSAAGNLTSFSGLFHVAELSENEKETLLEILKNHSIDEEKDLQSDLEQLVFLTSEVKAINNQAALLHGERIKKAQTILKSYREGAFTSWLNVTYGNRQTPYNLMYYYEFHHAMPKNLHDQIELMPRQAIYVLASREGDFQKKMQLIENYKGETKDEVLALIRELFPLEEKDKRRPKVGQECLKNLHFVFNKLERSKKTLNSSEKNEILKILEKIKKLVR